MKIDTRHLLLPFVFAGFTLIASGVYALMPLQGVIGTALSYILLPGVATYTAFNGSLLFGSGFGSFGSYAIIALGSAAVWAALAVAVYRLAAGLARRGRP